MKTLDEQYGPPGPQFVAIRDAAETWLDEVEFEPVTAKLEKPQFSLCRLGFRFEESFLRRERTASKLPGVGCKLLAREDFHSLGGARLGSFVTAQYPATRQQPPMEATLLWEDNAVRVRSTLLPDPDMEYLPHLIPTPELAKKVYDALSLPLSHFVTVGP